MDKNIPYDLIGKVLSKNASESEIEEFKKWENNNPESEIILNDLKDIYYPDSEDVKFDSFAALNKINSKLEDKNVLPRSYYIIRFAAALAIIFGISALFLFQDPGKKVTVIAHTEVREIELEDGTIITLKKGTKLIYPEKFNKKDRSVELEGEAYFNVAANKDKPFKIYTEGVTTEVLGTKFNLVADNNNVRIDLDEGKVKFYNKKSAITLQPKQAAIFNIKEKKLKTDKYSENSKSWQTKSLIFENTKLSKALIDIENYYNVKFIIEGNCPDTISLNAEFKERKLQDVINALEFAFNANISHSDSTYVIEF